MKKKLELAEQNIRRFETFLRQEERELSTAEN